MNKDLEDYAFSIIPECGCLGEMIEIVSMQKGYMPDDAWECEMLWDDFWSKHQDGCPDCD